MSHVLRPYQTECVTAVIDAIRGGVQRPYYVLPTGTGKTATAVEIINRLRAAQQEPSPALFLAHRRELLTQARNALLRANPGLIVGIEQGECHAPRHCDVFVASVPTLAAKSRRLQWLAEFRPCCVFVDENHHSPSDSFSNVIDRFAPRGTPTPVIGMTATPARFDRLALHGRPNSPFDALVYDYPIRKAISDGYLCDIRGYQVKTQIDISGVKTTAGDYNAKDLAAAIDTQQRTAQALTHWREIAADRQTIAFCASVEHAEHAADAWREAGYRSACVTGDMDKFARDRILLDYAAGRIQVLTNVQVLTEGYDNPATSCILMLRPTQSWGLACQMIGRGTRISDGKTDCLVIDVVDVTEDHKLDDRPRATKTKKTQVTCAAMLGLPDDLDLEGHTVAEACELREEMTQKADILRLVKAESFSQIETYLAKASLFMGVSDADHDPLADISPYRWQPVGGDWVLRGASLHILVRPARDGRYWLKIDHADDGERQVKMPLSTDDLHEAIRRADGFAEESCGVTALRFALRDARWRVNKATDKQISLLTRRGIQFAASMSRGEASALISKMFAK